MGAGKAKYSLIIERVKSVLLHAAFLESSEESYEPEEVSLVYRSIALIMLGACGAVLGAAIFVGKRITPLIERGTISLRELLRATSKEGCGITAKNATDILYSEMN